MSKKELAEVKTGMLALAEEQGRIAQEQDDDTDSRRSIPMIKILQTLSPACKKNGASYVPGAEPGLLHINMFSPPLRQSVEFIHCALSISWNEWVPRERGGGFAGQHFGGSADAPPNLPGLRKAQDPDVRMPRWFRGDNELIYTRTHIGLVLDSGIVVPFAFPMTMTGIAISRTWKGQINIQSQIWARDNDLLAAPPYVSVWRIATTERTNNKGSFFVPQISFVRGLKSGEDDDVFAMAVQLAKAEVKVEHVADVPVEEPAF